MTAVITVPAFLDEQSFEQVLEQLAPLAPDAKLLVDARHCRFSTPYGLTGLLCLAQSRAEKADFAPAARADPQLDLQQDQHRQQDQGEQTTHGAWTSRRPGRLSASG